MHGEIDAEQRAKLAVRIGVHGQMTSMLASVERAKAAGATVLAGGHRLSGQTYGEGYFVAPTLIAHVGPNDEISQSELFGPITSLYRVEGFEEAITLANSEPGNSNTTETSVCAASLESLLTSPPQGDLQYFKKKRAVLRILLCRAGSGPGHRCH